MTELAITEPMLPAVNFTPEAEQLKMAALESASLVQKVANEAAQSIAVCVQSQIKCVLKAAEEARKSWKAPALARCRAIDDAHEKFVADILVEDLRITGLLGDYQTEQQLRISHHQAQYNDRLTQIERDREAALANIPNLSAADAQEASDRITEEYARRVRDLGPAPSTPRADGQRVTQEWEITVTDIFTLARALPNCVKITPRLAEIKFMLDRGLAVPGVSARRVVKSTVALKTPKELEA